MKVSLLNKTNIITVVLATYFLLALGHLLSSTQASSEGINTAIADSNYTCVQQYQAEQNTSMVYTEQNFQNDRVI